MALQMGPHRKEVKYLISQVGEEGAKQFIDYQLVDTMKMRYALAIYLSEKTDIITAIETKIAALKADMEILELIAKSREYLGRRAHLRLEVASSD